LVRNYSGRPAGDAAGDRIEGGGDSFFFGMIVARTLSRPLPDVSPLDFTVKRSFLAS